MRRLMACTNVQGKWKMVNSKWKEQEQSEEVKALLHSPFTLHHFPKPEVSND